MRSAAYPRDFDMFRRAALEAELAGKTLRAMARATASVITTAERLQRLVDAVSGNDEQSAPSPFDMYRSRAATPQGQVLPEGRPARGASAAHDLSVF